MIARKLFLVLLLFPATLWGKGFFEYSQVDLGSAEAVQLTSNQSELYVVLFFEPNCSWCFKQTQVLNQYLRHCSNAVQIYGLGVNGNRQELKAESWRLRARFPLYMASDELIADLGKVDATPLTILFDDQGQVVTYVKGYLPYKKWLSFLKGKVGASC